MTDRPWVLLPVEIKVREFHAKILQSAVAAERGFDVVLGEQNTMIRQMPALPRGVYIDKSIDRTKILPFGRLKAAGNKIAAWCEEGLVYRDRDAYLHERISEKSLTQSDIFFAWGGVQADDVGSYVPEAKSKIKISGNPRFDLLRPELLEFYDQAQDALREKYGRYILMATNFSRYNHFMGYDFWIEALITRGAIDSADQLEFYRRWRAHLGELYRSFAEALPNLAKAFPDHRIIVRPHPSENHEAWRKQVQGLKNVTVAYDGSAIPWIAGADAVIHNSCTTGLEAYLMGKSVTAYRPVKDDILDSYLPNAVSRQATDPEQLVSMVTAGLDSGPAEIVDVDIANYVAAREGPLAADQVVDHLERLDIKPGQAQLSLTNQARLAIGNAVGVLEPIVRRVRVGPRAHGYARQKFPGVKLAEVQSVLKRLAAITGRFGAVRAEAMTARRCFRFTTDDRA